MHTVVDPHISPRDADLEPSGAAAAGAGTPVSIRRPGGAWEWHQASALLHDFAEWILAAGGIDLTVDQPGFTSELDDLPAVYAGDRAEMFVAFDDGLAVGTVAVRHHDDGTSELKRMYVRRAARGRGVADRLVEHVAGAATQRRSRVLWLETLQGVMDPAIRLYARHGFVPSVRRSTIEHGDMLVMERPLAAASAGSRR